MLRARSSKSVLEAVRDAMMQLKRACSNTESCERMDVSRGIRRKSGVVCGSVDEVR